MTVFIAIKEKLISKPIAILNISSLSPKTPFKIINFYFIS